MGCRFITSPCCFVSCWNLFICNREREYARSLFTPEICLELNKMLYCMHFRSSLPIKIMTFFSLLRCLFKTSTRARLSMYNQILWFFILLPHKNTVSTMGDNSNSVIFSPNHDVGQEPYTHCLPLVKVSCKSFNFIIYTADK